MLQIRRKLLKKNCFIHLTFVLGLGRIDWMKLSPKYSALYEINHQLEQKKGYMSEYFYTCMYYHSTERDQGPDSQNLLIAK